MSDEPVPFPLPFPVPFQQQSYKYRTVKVDITHGDEFLKRLLGVLSGWGLRSAEVNNKGRISYSRDYPLSLGAFILVFIAAFAVAAVWMQISYVEWVESLSLLEHLRLDPPSIRENLLSDSALVALLFGVVAAFLWGLTNLEWSNLTISGGSKFLYLKFDVTSGDTYMIQLLDEIDMPTIEA